ncbi:MAG TPA: ABC transporter ATP-binding protein [Actinobacteria bacterium]|nr:galactose/methyl galactoside import ATP-binding protein MglA [bacterium BMS3Bbin01]HDH26785.1 ABC transporter ATP-binding protein [Actinomycetota bacterium]HDL49148.1 ABC transporter ATP-binding protein [Actinomycetota bacterium]
MDAESTGSTRDSGAPLIELIGITKRFPGVLANDNVSLSIERGEVHCLLGENGAGKSTLISILSGMTVPDAGTIRIDGVETEMDSPRKALDLGIGTVYQHATLVPTLTVLENLILGNTKGAKLNESEGLRRLDELASILGADVDPHAVTGDLALDEQQVIEIIKALWKGKAALILDEPTSMLTPAGVTELGNMLQRLKGSGLGVVFITHMLHEAIDMGDRVTVLRQGSVAGTIEPDELASTGPERLRDRIVEIMFGEEATELSDIAEMHVDASESRSEHAPLTGDGSSEERIHSVGEPILKLDGVSLGPSQSSHGLHDINLTVAEGEILGIAGVGGNGQKELAEVLAGQQSINGGQIYLRHHGEFKRITRLGVNSRQQMGLRYLSDDRRGEAVVGTMSVAINLVLKRIGEAPFWKRQIIQAAEVRRNAEAAVRDFDIRTPSVETNISKLSGGNIQKVILARETTSGPRIVVYNKPTHGLDVRTSLAVRERIRQMARDGVSAVVISNHLEELLDLCDRVAVLLKGRVAGIVENGPNAERRIGDLMIGVIAS